MQLTLWRIIVEIVLYNLIGQPLEAWERRRR
jgi:hypothetical protein